MTAVQPACPVLARQPTAHLGPTLASLVPIPAPDQQHQTAIFTLCPSRDLPVVDLSRTIAKAHFSSRTHRVWLGFMRNQFHYLVWFFRFGALCFAGLFFVQHGPAHYFFLSVMVPATAVLFATLLFLSLDVVRLLGQSYDFWFLTAINALNWMSFAYVLHDERAVMSFLGGFSFQIVVSVDASYRTMATAVNTMILAIPIVLVLCGLVSLQSVNKGNFFTVVVAGSVVCDAADIMGFTTSTLAILLAKMVLLKKRRVGAPICGKGYAKQPCALIRTTLRLVPVSSPVHRSPSRAHLTSTTTQPQIQELQLSPMQITHLDARRTIMPWRLWSSPRLSWLFRARRVIRRLFLALGGLAFTVLVVQTVVLHMYRRRLETYPDHTPTMTSTPKPDTCSVLGLTPRDRTLNVFAFLASIAFCGSFTLFFQLDLLRLLLLNFDYGFSIGQAVVFCVSFLDMRCWDTDAVLLVTAWLLWFTWALSIDAITPLVQHSPLRFPKKFAACGVLGGMIAGVGIVYDVVFQRNNGLRNRVVATIALNASHTLDITTRSVLLGRVATIALWSSRQAFVLLTRGADELTLIRGLLEYESPYSYFPRKKTKHTPALDDTDP